MDKWMQMLSVAYAYKRDGTREKGRRFLAKYLMLEEEMDEVEAYEIANRVMDAAPEPSLWEHIVG